MAPVWNKDHGDKLHEDLRWCWLLSNIYVMHVWESVWKASAAIAGFEQNFEQNLQLDEQNSEQTK